MNYIKYPEIINQNYLMKEQESSLKGDEYSRLETIIIGK